MKKEWLKELQANRRVMWLCRHNHQEKRKAKGTGSTTKVKEATSIRLVEINKNEVGLTREDLHTKASKGVVV